MPRSRFENSKKFTASTIPNTWMFFLRAFHCQIFGLPGCLVDSQMIPKARVQLITTPVNPDSKFSKNLPCVSHPIFFNNFVRCLERFKIIQNFVKYSLMSCLHFFIHSCSSSNVVLWNNWSSALLGDNVSNSIWSFDVKSNSANKKNDQDHQNTTEMRWSQWRVRRKNASLLQCTRRNCVWTPEQVLYLPKVKNKFGTIFSKLPSNRSFEQN